MTTPKTTTWLCPHCEARCRAVWTRREPFAAKVGFCLECGAIFRVWPGGRVVLRPKQAEEVQP